MGFFFSLHQFSDFALLALRIALGAVFLTHGLGKRKLWSTQPSAQRPTGMLRKLRILSIAEAAGGFGDRKDAELAQHAGGHLCRGLRAPQLALAESVGEEHGAEGDAEGEQGEVAELME